MDVFVLELGTRNPRGSVECTTYTQMYENSPIGLCQATGNGGGGGGFLKPLLSEWALLAPGPCVALVEQPMGEEVRETESSLSAGWCRIAAVETNIQLFLQSSKH